MERSFSVLYEFMWFLSGTIIFVVLFVTTLKVLKQMSIFQGTTAVIVAICVSLLSAIGLSRFFVITDATCKTAANRCDITLDFILLPYAALALSILLILLLWLISRISRNRRDHRANESCKEIPRRMR